MHGAQLRYDYNMTTRNRFFNFRLRTNSFPSKPKDTTIDIYWTWDGRALDTSGKAILFLYTMIVPGIQNTWWR
jgi:hypothetical protein